MPDIPFPQYSKFVFFTETEKDMLLFSISIEFSSKKKNKFIKSFSKINPVTTFQNEMNATAETDFYAYKDYRTRIQDMIDKKIELILEDTWNNVTVDENRYAEYVKIFK